MLTIREATPNDVSTILDYIKELATWLSLEDDVMANEETLARHLFRTDSPAHAVIAEAEGKPVGYCIYFYNFSSFLSRKGIYIEDIYVTRSARGNGYGKEIFSYFANKVIAEKCARLEWSVPNDNTEALKFYDSMDPYVMSEWTTQRLEGDALRAVAA